MKVIINHHHLKHTISVTLTSSSLQFSIGFTLHIMLTTRRVSMSSGSGDADFTDSAVSGEIARGLGVGGCFAENAVRG